MVGRTEQIPLSNAVDKGKDGRLLSRWYFAPFLLPCSGSVASCSWVFKDEVLHGRNIKRTRSISILLFWELSYGFIFGGCVWPTFFFRNTVMKQPSKKSSFHREKTTLPQVVLDLQVHYYSSRNDKTHILLCQVTWVLNPSHPREVTVMRQQQDVVMA